MEPVFELNRINVMKMVGTLSKNYPNTSVSPVVLSNIFKRSAEEIKKVMDELVLCKLLIREEKNVKEELGEKTAEHFGNIFYRLPNAENLFSLDDTRVLEKGIQLEEEEIFDAAEICYRILMERDNKSYHALFCLARLKRKKGYFDSGLIRSALKEAREQEASVEVIDLIDGEAKLMLSMLPDNQERHKLKFAGQGKYNFEVIFTCNKTSSGVLRGNTILMKISRHPPIGIQITAIDSLKRRMLKRIKEGNIVAAPEEVLKDFKDGDSVEVDGHIFKLRIFYEDKRSSSGKLLGNTMRLRISANLSEKKKKRHVNDLVRMLISDHRLPKLRKIVGELNKEHFNVKVNNIRFKKQMSRWGSCSSNGNINISYRLLFAPEDVLKYVCIHELAHLIEPNHSQNFWKLVKRAMPDYKEKIEWLKKHGRKLSL